jgi:iron(III) transport system substrate-binding protein
MRLRLAHVGTIALLFAATISVSPAVAQQGSVMIYSGINEGIHAKLTEAFNKKYPNVSVKAFLTGTGPATERVIAERANPQADVIYGVNTIALEQLKTAGVLQPYAPKGSRIPAEYADADGFYVHHWLTVMVMAVNTKVLADRNLPMPVSWEDLIKPGYKGLITIASPTKSGTGLTIFTTLLDAFGWNYIDNIHRNIFQYNESGGAAGRQAGAGEIAVGLTYDTVVLDQIKAGLPVKLVFPTLTPNIMEGGGLVARAPNAANGRLWLDFMTSDEAVKIYAPSVGAATTPGYSNLDLKGVSLWKMQRPIDANEFKREWARKYEK